MAIGLAKVLGIKLMQNFRRPYFAQSISEFWHRWHISLSTWFRDYVYIPLGGNRVVKWQWYFNLFTTFVISGFWHGAEWTYVIWGAIHGLYSVFGILTKKKRQRIANALRMYKLPRVFAVGKILVTFFLVCFGWIFFRANNLPDAIYVIKNSLPLNISLSSIKNDLIGLGIHQSDLIILVSSIGIMELIHLLQEQGKGLKDFNRGQLVLKWAVYYSLIFIIIFWGCYGVVEKSQFIYFQF